MKSCKKCGFMNEDANKFCANCGTELKNTEVEEGKEEAVSSGNETESKKKKGLILTISALVLILIIPLIVVMCTTTGSGATKNVKKYVYRGDGAGNGSYFLIEFDDNGDGTYKYEGTDVSPYTGLFRSGTLQTNGLIFYKKTIDGIKQYNFYDDPWDKTSSYVYIDENKRELIVFNSISYYAFQEE